MASFRNLPNADCHFGSFLYPGSVRRLLTINMYGPEMSSVSESSEKRAEEGGFSVIRTVAGNCSSLTRFSSSNQILPRPNPGQHFGPEEN